VIGVTVNLSTGVATGTDGVSNFQHVFGGSGNDSLAGSAAVNILVGNAGDDTLFGNDGRDILIGGLGADLLDGGSDDDVLIGARSSYDANPVALIAIAQEWTRTDLGYSVRRDHISGLVAGGLNGAFVFNATTVFDDTRTPDTLWGRGGIDWFIYGTRDDLKDQVPGETKTKI
jgi:Ca2+-binding RTX toxin-like protein